MKKKLCSLLALAFFLTLVLLTPTPQARASAKLPFTIDCRTGCESWGQWSGGTTYGMYDLYQVSNPNTTICNVCNWARMNMLSASSSSDTTNSIVMGLMKQNGLNGWCGSASNNVLYYSVQAFGSGGISDHIYTHCTAVPSADIGGNVAWKIAPYTSNGGGMLVQLFSTSYDGTVNNTSAFYISYASGIPHSFTRIKRDEFLFAQPFSTGHWVWGVNWENAQWAQGNGTLNYITRGFDTSSIVPAISFYWNIVPAPGNLGGSLYSCIYDPPPTACTIGG